MASTSRLWPFHFSTFLDCFLRFSFSLVFLSISSASPSTRPQFLSSTTSFVGLNGIKILPCDYDGTLSPRISGAVHWSHEPFAEGEPAQIILKAWPPSRGIPPKVMAFQGALQLSPSDAHGKASLRISNFDEKMAGRFKCEIFYKSSSDFEEKAIHEVHMAHLSTPVLQGGEELIRATEGSPITLSCSVAAAPRPVISWHLDGEVIDVGIRLEPDEEMDFAKRDYVSSWTLTPERTLLDKEIKCIVNGQAITTVPSAYAKWPQGIVASSRLQVYFPPDQPYITLEEAQWFYEGTVVALGCTVADRGNPSANIKMTFPNAQSVETDIDSVVHKSFKLTSNFHGEKVKCEADPGVEEMRRTTEKTLKIAFGPDSVHISGNAPSLAGLPLTLLCSARAANPEAEIRWFFDGISRARVRNQTRLEITPSWRDDGKRVACRGRNPYYSDLDRDVEDSVVLDIKHKPVWNVSANEMRVLKSAGQEALLSCSVTSNPSHDLKYKWTFARQFISDRREIKIRASSDTFGDYTCEASNVVGISSFVVALVDVAAEDAAKAQVLGVVVIGVALAAVLLVVFVVLLVWRCRIRKQRMKEEAAFRSRRTVPDVHDASLFRLGPSAVALANHEDDDNDDDETPSDDHYRRRAWEGMNNSNNNDQPKGFLAGDKILYDDQDLGVKYPLTSTPYKI